MLDTFSDRERLLVAAQAAGWICIALLLLIALWIGGRIFWRLVDSDRPLSPAAGNPAVNAVNSDQPRVDLAGLHLFGQSGMAAAPQAYDAPETSLDLVLVGTLAADEPEAGMAIIADADGDGFYQVGDTLPGDAELREVHTDRIVLAHQGRLETLRLRDEDASRTDRPRRSAGRTQASSPPLAGIRGSPGQTGVNWAQVQQNLRIDPAELARQVRAMPHMENGRQIGVRLQAGRDTLLFSKLGLRNTDIITSVNNIPLDNPARALELVNQLSSSSQFQVRLRRDGRDMTLNIDANQLAR